MFVLFLVLAVFLIILWSQVSRNAAKAQVLEEQLNQMLSKLDEMSRSMRDLRAGMKPGAEPAQTEPPPSKVSPAQIIHVPMPAASSVEPRSPTSPETKPFTIPVAAPEPATPPTAAKPEVLSPPVTAAESPRLAAHPRRTKWELPTFDWESLVGVKLFSWVAGVALLLAVVFFLRYSINQGWLMPQVRMTIGILVGIGLLALCELKAARRYPVTANAMDASAIAILFSTFYAAHALWDLIGSVPAFFLMVVITAIAVLLSIRRDSVFIALLGLLGGFATPALLSAGENSPISLFTYLLLLNAGLAWVATKKRWPLLMTFSLVFTVFYQWGWVIKFLNDSQLPIALGIFLVFPILAFVAAPFRRRQDNNGGWTSLYGQTANITALLPLLFNLYLAAVPAYGHRYILLFSFLLLLDAGLFIIAAVRGPEILHLVGGLSTLLIPAIWLYRSYESSAWPGVLIFLVLFTFLYLFAPLLTQHFGRGFSGPGRWAAYTASIILFAFPALVFLEPRCAAPAPLFGVLLMLLLALSGYAIFAETGPVYFIAALFALITEALWAQRYLTPDRLTPGLVLFAVFGILYIGVPVLARRWQKSLQPALANSCLMLLSIALLFFLSTGQMAASAIWGQAILLLLLNAGLIAHRSSLSAIAGMTLSWIVLASLWLHVSLESRLIPSLIVMGIFALFVLAGNIRLQKKTQEEGAEDGIFLGLTGHLFLMAIAAQPSLSIPPWPFLCVLFVLDIAIGLSALYLRRHELHRAAMAGSALVLMTWVVTAGLSPWPGIAIQCAAGLSLFSFIWIYLAVRSGMDTKPFSMTAAMTVFLAQILSILAATQSGVPSVGYLILAHVLFLLALMALAWPSCHQYVVIAVVPTAVAVSFWMIRNAGPQFWPQQLGFAASIYLLFIAYPLLLGRRAAKSIHPYLAAVLAGVPFFFQARHAMLQAGWENVIGILPVTQAILMGFLVLRLLRIELHSDRALGRLAMVAGTALAFITVAIPLQLEKEWITLGWVLEGAALSWLFRKIPHKGLLYTAAGLFAAVFARLALNPLVLTYATRSDIRIWNWYLYTYLLSAAAMIVGSRFLVKTEDRLFQNSIRLSKLIPAGAVMLLFLLLNIEIADYYSVGPTITFNFSATLAQDLTYTLGWALFSVALLAVGIALRKQSARIAALGLLVATSVKCFIHDLARLGELYRVMSFVGLGVCLALVALALQKFVFAERKKESETTETVSRKP